ncbi:hypothetical protein HOY80DRAFT_1112580 [Tuber brumale]|nr:hypothetical protein HOY80DRAFT_1112580 [Tuber brumale]
MDNDTIITTDEEAAQWKLPNTWNEDAWTVRRSILCKNLIIGFIYQQTHLLLPSRINFIPAQPESFNWIFRSDLPESFWEYWAKLTISPDGTNAKLRKFTNYSLDDNRFLLEAISKGWVKATVRKRARAESSAEKIISKRSRIEGQGKEEQQEENNDEKTEDEEMEEYWEENQEEKEVKKEKDDGRVDKGSSNDNKTLGEHSAPETENIEPSLFAKISRGELQHPLRPGEKWRMPAELPESRALGSGVDTEVKRFLEAQRVQNQTKQIKLDKYIYERGREETSQAICDRNILAEGILSMEREIIQEEEECRVLKQEVILLEEKIEEKRAKRKKLGKVVEEEKEYKEKIEALIDKANMLCVE